MTSRLALLGATALLACCSGQRKPDTAPTTAATSVVQQGVPASAVALAAKAVAQDYFAMLKARRLPEAHALWVPGAAGPLPAFSKALSRDAAFSGEAGAPSAVRTTAGVDYVLVEAVTDTVNARGTKTRRHGVVMLKRAAGGTAPWRIWGTDIHTRRCKEGEQPRGSGCVAA